MTQENHYWNTYQYWTGNRGIQYTQETNYVDIDTGEQIPKKEALNKNNYITITRQTHETTYNTSGTKCTIRCTARLRKQPQQKLNFS